MDILETICKDNNIDLISVDDELAKILNLTENEVPSGQGFAMGRKNNNPRILYNSSNEWEKNLIVSHEIAHCLFGHLSKPFNSEIDPEYSELYEFEARAFASAFVANMLWNKYKDIDTNNNCEVNNMSDLINENVHILSLKEAFLHILYLVEQEETAIEIIGKYRTCRNEMLSVNEYPNDTFYDSIIKTYQKIACIRELTKLEKQLLNLDTEQTYYVDTIHYGQA